MAPASSQDYTYHEHAPEEDLFCPVCTHPQGSMLSNAFVGGEKVDDLCELFKIEPSWIYAHARANDLMTARVGNTKGLYGKIINDYLNNYDAKKVSVFGALKAAEQLDRVEGRYHKDPPVMDRIYFVTAPSTVEAKKAIVIEERPVQAALAAPSPTDIVDAGEE